MEGLDRSVDLATLLLVFYFKFSEGIPIVNIYRFSSGISSSFNRYRASRVETHPAQWSYDLTLPHVLGSSLSIGASCRQL